MFQFDPYEENSEYAESAENCAIEENAGELMEGIIDMLPDRQAEVIKMKMGFCVGGEHTQEEIAEIMGISQPAVHKLERKALANLRSLLEELPVGRDLVADFEVENGLVAPTWY